jgi:hypothetical protein
MIALRTNFEYWGYKSGYWQWHAERTRRYAEQVRERRKRDSFSIQAADFESRKTI